MTSLIAIPVSLPEVKAPEIPHVSGRVSLVTDPQEQGAVGYEEGGRGADLLRLLAVMNVFLCTPSDPAAGLDDALRQCVAEAFSPGDRN